jgi:hypothetical protein
MWYRAVIQSASYALVLLLPGSAGHVFGNEARAKFERVYELQPREGVFAYSRISPDGKLLAYASEMPQNGRIMTTVTVVDLATKKVLFTELGIDAYFSNDNKSMIYLSQVPGGSAVVMWHPQTETMTRGVAPSSLGDYFSWGVRDGKNLIMTIQSNYYYLDGDKAVLPHSRVSPCPNIGVGDRPLISKDGRKVTTFVRGNVVVRGIDNCNDILDTGIEGGKADFSFDGRYVAMHGPKERGTGYDIFVVDLRDRTVRNVTANMTGSSLFPSWTLDGRLSFRYDSPEYRGFMFASDVLNEPAKPLPRPGERLSADRTWQDVFPETALPKNKLSLVVVWGTWSAHMPDALLDLEQAHKFFSSHAVDVSVLTATDPVSREADITRLSPRGTRVKRIPLAPERLKLTEMHNQNPTTLLFRDGKLIDRRMGAQTFQELVEWVEGKGR